MTAPMNPRASSRFDTVLAGLAGGLLAYWGAFALLAPVTVWDSQTYNLGRLAIARQGGLFANPLWTSERQVMFPWSFDAIHLPFIPLGWGYALPSFLCLLGIAWMLFQGVAQLATRRVAWLAVIALCSLPTVVYQATSTKNDLGLVFVAGFAAYSLFRFRADSSESRWLALNALAVGFLPGVKNAGLPLAVVAGAVVVVLLRREPRRLACWLGTAAVAFLLLGSSEILLNNQLTYRHPLGLESVVNAHSNRDGLAGAAANFVRYVFGLLNPGLDPTNPNPEWAAQLERSCRVLLGRCGLTDQGVRGDFPDQSLRFYKLGWEAASDFGPVGCVAMITAALRLAFLRRRDVAWWCALSGWALVALTAATIAWMPWNNRFLMLPVILFVLAALLAARRVLAGSRWLAGGVLAFLLHGAVVYPLHSFNKRPADLVASIKNREGAMLRERSSMKEVVEAVREHHRAEPDATWLLHAGSDSWVFCLLDLPEPRLHLVPSPSLEMIRDQPSAQPQQPRYLLVLNRAWTPPAEVELVKRFQWEADSALYRWPARTPAPR